MFYRHREASKGYRSGGTRRGRSRRQQLRRNIERNNRSSRETKATRSLIKRNLHPSIHLCALRRSPRISSSRSEGDWLGFFPALKVRLDGDNNAKDGSGIVFAFSDEEAEEFPKVI